MSNISFNKLFLLITKYLNPCRLWQLCKFFVATFFIYTFLLVNILYKSIQNIIIKMFVTKKLQQHTQLALFYFFWNLSQSIGQSTLSKSKNDLCESQKYILPGAISIIFLQYRQTALTSSV